MYVQKTKTIILYFILILVIFIPITGITRAETIEVSDGHGFHDAIDAINKNSDADNTILLLNDIEMTDNTFTKEDYDAALSRIVAIDYTGSGNLTIKSNSTDSRRFYTNFSNTSCSPFFNISGNDTTVTFENVVFDGYGIFVGKKLGFSDHSSNVVLKDAQVVNGVFSGVQLYNTNDSVLDNVTISDSAGLKGGGLRIMYCENLTIQDCTISNNTVTAPAGYNPKDQDAVSGGGVQVIYSSVDIGGDTKITDNVAEWSDLSNRRPKGGGIDSDQSYIRIFDKTNISNNSVIGTGLTVGGGIFTNLTEYNNANNHPTGLEITGNAVISKNKALEGGGIYINHATDSYRTGIFNISGDTQITENTAEKTKEHIIKNVSRGAGIFTLDPVNISNNVVIQGNKAVDNSSSPGLTIGGGLCSQGAVNLSGAVHILDNEADYGAGVCSYNPVDIRGRVLIADNKGYMGGGLYSMAATNIQDYATISQNDARLAGGGVFISRSTMQVSDNVEISNNTAGSGADYPGYGGGGIFVNNSTVTITDDVLIGNNTAQNGGGILALNISSLSLSNNTTLDNNYADNADNNGGLGGGVCLIHSNLQTSGGSDQTVLLSQNSAYGDGGGIFAQSGNVTLSGETVFAGNAAGGEDEVNRTVRNGFGGGLCLISSSAEISGGSDQTVTFYQNTAFDDGGAVFIFLSGSSEQDLMTYNSFKKTDDSALVFYKNAASEGYLWNLTDPDLKSNMTFIKEKMPVMKNTVFTEPFSNAYNNFDINFDDGEKVTPAIASIRYFADSLTELNRLDDDDMRIVSYVGGNITEDDVIQISGKDWLNLYQPHNYNEGKLQESLPMTLTEPETSLNILYLNGTNHTGGNNSTGGGSGTGNATVTNPSGNGSTPPGNGSGPGPGTTEPEEPAASVLIILLFMIAIACYAYVTREENEEDKLYMV